MEPEDIVTIGLTLLDLLVGNKSTCMKGGSTANATAEQSRIREEDGQPQEGPGAPAQDLDRHQVCHHPDYKTGLIIGAVGVALIGAIAYRYIMEEDECF